MIFRSLKITFVLLLLSFPAVGQVLTRSEFAPYNLRKDAESRTRTASDSHIEFQPTSQSSDTFQQIIDVPQSWLDQVVMIHLEGVGSAYTLSVNGYLVAQCEDSLTPTDYDISQYVGVGQNAIQVIKRTSRFPMLEEGIERSRRAAFDGSYIYTQSRLRILDYQTNMTQHTEGQHGRLFIDIIVENRFNYAETIEVGFDIYDPYSNLLDFSTAKATLEGNSIDTIRFSPHLYGAAAKNRWGTTSPKLYSVMAFTKRTGLSSGYIPFKAGFFVAEYDDATISVWDKPLTIKLKRYNTLGNKAQTQKELTAILKSGYNTVKPDYPQPLWFYSLCDEIGLYVIDQAAINAPSRSTDRSVGGTPSNDPKLAGEYLERVQRMYYRTRNFTCIIAYSLGGDSGNGYNMYKAYQWLKGIEQERPIIYSGAAGEWNSDKLTIEQ